MQLLHRRCSLLRYNQCIMSMARCLVPRLHCEPCQRGTGSPICLCKRDQSGAVPGQGIWTSVRFDQAFKACWLGSARNWLGTTFLVVQYTQTALEPCRVVLKHANYCINNNVRAPLECQSTRESQDGKLDGGTDLLDLLRCTL